MLLYKSQIFIYHDRILGYIWPLTLSKLDEFARSQSLYYLKVVRYFHWVFETSVFS